MQISSVKYIRDEKGIKLLGRKIKQLRLQQKISQSQLAFEAGITYIQVGRIERGQINTSVSNVFAIANALNVSPKDLFDF